MSEQVDSQTQRSKSDDLRRRAEAYLEELGSSGQPLPNSENLSVLLEELSIHQIELQMQSEELRGANEALARSRDSYFQHFISAPVPALRLSQQSAVLEANIAAAEVLGVPFGTWNRRTLFFPGSETDSRERVRFSKALMNAFADKEPVELSLSLPVQNCGLRVFEISLHVVDNGFAPQQREALAYLRDITEMRKAFEEIERLSLVAKRTASAVIITDAQRRITWVNDSFTTITGYRFDEAISKNPAFLQGPKTDPAQVRFMRERLDAREPYTIEIQNHRKGGEPHWIRLEVSPRWDEHGNLQGFFSLQTDITEAKLREEELVALRTAVEQSPSTVVITDPEVRIVYANPAFEKITGYRLEEVIGQNPRILKSGDQDEAFYQEMWRQLESGQAWQGVFRNRRKDGTLFYEEAQIAPVKDAHGRLSACIAIKTDISERMRSQEQMKQLNSQLQDALIHAEHMAKEAESANQAKSDFLANMSHEIRTPMNGVISVASLLMDTDLTPVQQRYAEIIRSSGQTLLALINDILDFSRIEAGQIDLVHEAFSLRDLVKDLEGNLRLQAEAKGLRFEVEVAEDLSADYLGDASRIRQILLNLLGNAVKFTETGGVTLRVRSLNSPDAAGAGGSALPLVEFAVEDTGIGIAADKLKLLFGRFSQLDASVTREFGGSGLGLAISQQLAHMMSGQIDVTSQAGKGSRFALRLPLEPVDTQTASPPATKPPMVATAFPAIEPESVVQTSVLDDKYVLLVEDNPVNQMVAKELLRQFGLPADIANDGREALAAVAAKRYDLILMDVQMPHLDGLEATKRIRMAQQTGEGPEGLRLHEQTPEHLPIIAMTAHAMAGDRDKCLCAGMDDYISKPIDPELFRACMQQWLDSATEPPPVDSAAAGGRATADSNRPQQDDSKVSASLTPVFNHEAMLVGLKQNIALARQIIKVYLDAENTLQADIRSAMEQADCEAVRTACHSLRGAVGYLAAPRVMNQLIRINQAAQSGDVEQVRQQWPVLERLLNQLEQELRRAMARWRD